MAVFGGYQACSMFILYRRDLLGPCFCFLDSLRLLCSSSTKFIMSIAARQLVWGLYLVLVKAAMSFLVWVDCYCWLNTPGGC